MTREASSIRVGFQVWGQFVSAADLIDQGALIEQLGFDSVWSNDHFRPAARAAAASPEGLVGPFFEGWMTLAGFAAALGRTFAGDA